MKVDSLEVGQVVKNYKELCQLLEVEPKKGGDSKKAQLKEIERYVNFNKQGYKFIVKEIYTEPLQIIDGRLFSSKAAQYIDDLELLLINFLLYNKGDITISKSGLYTALKMVNSNYNKYNGNKRPLLAKDMQIDLDVINEYYNDTSSILGNAIKTVLNRLVRKKLIYKTDTKVKAQLVVVPEKVNVNGDISIRPVIHTDENDIERVDYVPSKLKTTIEHVECTNEEIKKIMAIERKVITQMGYSEGIGQNVLVASGKYKEFKNKVNPILVDEMNVAYAYDAYKILFNYDDIKSEQQYILDKMERQQKEAYVNGLMQKHIYDRAEKSIHKTYDKAFNEFGIEFIDNINKMKPREQILMKDNYLKSVESLNGKLIHYYTTLESNY